MAENKRHKGHRQRMRERVQSYGLDSLAEHEALEYVLYLTNAQKDTNGIAHDLIDRFGDFAAVLEASEEELCTVEGVGPATARMLHLLPQICRYYSRSRTSTTRCIKTTEQMGSYLMAKFAWSDYERAMLVSLDSRKRVRAAVWLREGTTDRVSLDIKDVVSAAIKGGTDTVVLSHNHPNGAALPSMEDLEATGNIARALGLVNIHLLDPHTYSMVFGWYLCEMARKLQNGAELRHVISEFETQMNKMEVILGPYSLKQMKKSGRISAAAAVMGELMGIRPIITLIDGKTKVEGKVRGDDKVVPAMIELCKKRAGDVEDFDYMIGHTNIPQAAELEKACKKAFGKDPLITFTLGGVVSANTGPDTLALVYVGHARD